ncbi:MFS transporter [Dactylosporangium sp. NPDC000555]|uniref:MFS transporter n=1 Tax=Dactylosporangium sp. NPDC000555 TaxID=3154260 RepID=UPI00331D3181
MRPSTVRVGGLLRTRNFALLWIGQSTSAVGSAMTTVALPLVAISTLHAGPAMVALLTAATWLPWLLIGLPDRPLPLLATEARTLRDFPAQGTPNAVP